MPKRAVLYARVSSDDTRNEDRNLAGQLAMCRAYAAAHGYEIVAELAEDDRGASGAAFELPKLNRVRELARAGAIDVVVTRELDRLSRRLAKQLFVEDELARSGVALEYVLAEYAPTPEGSFLKNIRASFAEYERLKIAERMARGRRLQAEAGGVLVSGSAPYGYRAVLEGRLWRLEIEPDEAAVVRDVFAWYAAGLSLAQVVARLDAAGVPTARDVRPVAGHAKRRPYGSWARSTIADMLTNEVYRGIWRYGKTSQAGGRHKTAEAEQVPVAVPELVSAELWAQVQARRVANKDAAPRSTKHEYLLRRRVTCGACGIKLTADAARGGGERAKTYLYYVCPATNKGQFPHRCHAPGFPAPAVDALVWSWVRELLTNPAALENGLRKLAGERAAEQASLQDRLDRCQRDIDRLEAELRRLAGQYTRGVLPEHILDAEAAPRRAQLAGRQRERERLQVELAGDVAGEAAIAAVLALAAGMADNIAVTERNFSYRRWVIEQLDVVAVLSVVEGVKWVDASLVFGSRLLPLASGALYHLGHKGQIALTMRGRLP